MKGLYRGIGFEFPRTKEVVDGTVFGQFRGHYFGYNYHQVVHPLHSDATLYKVQYRGREF